MKLKKNNDQKKKISINIKNRIRMKTKKKKRREILMNCSENRKMTKSKIIR